MPVSRMPPGEKPAPNDYEKAIPSVHTNNMSALIGGILLVLALLGLFWWMGMQQSSISRLMFPGPASTPTAAVSQVAALLAVGITLEQPTASAALDQQQATQLANQFEPDAATKAQSMTANYVVLSYTPTASASALPNLNNVSVWMLCYQRVPYVPADASVDPTPFPHSYHDLYVFIDANSGKELLSVWV